MQDHKSNLIRDQETENYLVYVRTLFHGHIFITMVIMRREQCFDFHSLVSLYWKHWCC